MYTIQASGRQDKEDITLLRKQGLVPAVFYGFNKKATSVSVKASDFKKIWKEAGESSQVTLETPEGKVETLIHDVQFDPVRGMPIHIDFLAIDTTKEVTVNVPIEFEGDSDAVKGGLGSLVKVLHEIEISALPKDLPHALHIDISPLKEVGHQIHVSDIKIPTGVTLKTGPEEVVALIAAMKEEKEEVIVDLSTIEVEEKGKKKTEGEEGAEEAEKEETPEK